MKTLTQLQQSVINNLTQEFIRINSTNKASNKFNLIDVASLNQVSEEIKRNEAEAVADNECWRIAAMQEADRIVALLSKDLPMARVERYGESNGHYEMPDVLIAPNTLYGVKRMHHESYVNIGVVVRKEIQQQTHGCVYKKGVSLQYHYHNTPNSSMLYDTIEELLEKSNALRDIRTIVINKSNF
jgi:hypothetical protein